MKHNLIITAIFFSAIIYANIDYLNGITGLTKKDGGLGCLCHSLSPNDSVIVWIEGPDTVYRNDTIDYKLYMTGGPAITGGFDLAVYFGTLDSADTLTYVSFGELTHSMPNYFINDTVSWNFKYSAPDTIVADTFYATGNSTNNDSIPTDLDIWNHAQNFIVNVIDEPVYVKNENISPEGFVLYQNYPNPFNPTTKISFSVPNSPLSFGVGLGVRLLVYDVLGNELATLVNDELTAGKYEVEFDASQLSSGIYYYRLIADSYSDASGFSETRKMILIR